MGGVWRTANGGNKLVLERYGRKGVMFIGRGVAYCKTGLHRILLISTTDLIQPPRAIVHPPPTSSSLHLRLFIHGLLFIQSPPRAPRPATVQPALSTRVLFNHPSMGYCSSSPPPATVQPALHRLLFNQPSTGSCSSSPPRGPVHPPARSIGVLFIQRQRPLLPRGPIDPTPPPGTVHPNPPQLSLFIQRGSIDRLQLAAVAKESLGFS